MQTLAAPPHTRRTHAASRCPKFSISEVRAHTGSRQRRRLNTCVFTENKAMGQISSKPTVGVERTDCRRFGALGPIAWDHMFCHHLNSHGDQIDGSYHCVRCIFTACVIVLLMSVDLMLEVSPIIGNSHGIVLSHLAHHFPSCIRDVFSSQ